MRAKNTSTVAMLEPEVGSARAQFLSMTKTSFFFGLPGLSSSEPCASSSESDSGDFVYGTLTGRSDQRDHWFRKEFTSLNTIDVSKAKTILAGSLVGSLTKYEGSNRFSRFVIAGFLSFFHRSPFFACPEGDEKKPSFK